MAAINLFNQDPLSRIIIGTEGVGSIRGGGGGSIMGGIAIGGGAAIILNNTIKNASEEAKDKEANTSPCQGCTEKEQEERKKKLEDEANVQQESKGKTQHGEKDGGLDQANEDFDSLKPDNVKTINTGYGPARTGTLKNGQNVTVRPGSSDGRPTLEIRTPTKGNPPGAGRGTEIRYNQ